MVKALHAAGIEVILDVVYNHTCEGNHLGPTLSLRGIDNATYYWLMPEPALLPRLHRHRQQRQRVESGGGAPDRRFAALLGRPRCTSTGFASTWPRRWDGWRRGEFSPQAPIFQIIAQDPVLSRVKLIAEPWDIGLGGYQVGQLPGAVRRVERQVPRRPAPLLEGRREPGVRGRLPAGGLGRPVPGRAPPARRPASTSSPPTTASRCTIWSATASKHNEANGERNQDGADDNQSWNHGVEGETDDPAIIALRERQQRNLLATLLLSQGVPMLLGGDEIGRTQRGNNNAYCQDNEISWFDWNLDDRRRALLEFTRRLIALRRRHPDPAAAPVLRGRLHLGVAGQRTSPGCGPTARR